MLRELCAGLTLRGGEILQPREEGVLRPGRSDRQAQMVGCLLRVLGKNIKLRAESKNEEHRVAHQGERISNERHGFQGGY